MGQMMLALMIVPLGLFVMKCIKEKYIFSPLITLSCMAIALLSGAHGRAFVCAAYVFSVIGDFFLAHKDIHKDSYLFGIGGFFLAHTGFLLYALTNSEITWITYALAGILMVPYGFYLIRKLYPALHNLPMQIAVSLYMLISLAVFSCAFSMSGDASNKIVFILGIGMILFSDTVISVSDFLGNRKWDGFILPTYYLCHILVCLSTVL